MSCYTHNDVAENQESESRRRKGVHKDTMQSQGRLITKISNITIKRLGRGYMALESPFCPLYTPVN